MGPKSIFCTKFLNRLEKNFGRPEFYSHPEPRFFKIFLALMLKLFFGAGHNCIVKRTQSPRNDYLIFGFIFRRSETAIFWC